MKLKFKRIISKGNFIPEIDGLRFIAIASVLLYHLNGFLLEKDTNNYDVDYNFDFIHDLLSVGHLGVPLFFVISGFILARPFAQMHLSSGNKINLKSYFLRRLTRLEPPYILIMTILLFAAIYVAKTISLQDGLISYLSSITYTHNFVYGRGILPLLNAVAWSLEIEIQFYILMPILAKLFLITKKQKRRITIICLALLFLVLDVFETLPFISIINYLHYFLIGLLLADFYICNKGSIKINKLSSAISVLLFAAIWGLELSDVSSSMLKIVLEMLQVFSIFAFYYLVIIHGSVRLLANPIITNIGGMCYTIYLLHYPIISLFGNPLMKISFSSNSLINTIAYATIIILVVMLISAIFFLMIERPCMDKDWYKKILKRSPTKGSRDNSGEQITKA